MRRMIQDAPAPKVAVSPIVGGEAIKGPAAKMMRELGQMVSPLTVVDHFDDLLDGFVMDHSDAEIAGAVQVPTLVTATLMTDLASKKQLAQEIIAFGAQLIAEKRPSSRSGPQPTIRPG
jgi:LPPG:FO 2-phospho-L-lactate transferase